MEHPRRVIDFPEEWQSVIFSLETKEGVRDQLIEFVEMHRKKGEPQVGNWGSDITRLTGEIGSLRFGLPPEILKDYDRIRKYRKLESKGSDAFSEGDRWKAQEYFKKAKTLFEGCDSDCENCCKEKGEESCSSD